MNQYRDFRDLDEKMRKNFELKKYCSHNKTGSIEKE